MSGYALLWQWPPAVLHCYVWLQTHSAGVGICFLYRSFSIDNVDIRSYR